jgi:hypothetical protein
MFSRALCISLLISSCCVFSLGQLQNGGFNAADPDPNRVNHWFVPPLFYPLHWETLNYACLHSSFIPYPEYGQTVSWTIPAPVEGNQFVLLSTGDAEGIGSDPRIEFSSIQQTITACPGDILTGSYFFGTCDYRPFNDIGTITLMPIDPNNGLRPLVLLSICIEDLGDFQSTEGWQSFYHRFTEDTCGQYYLYCEVRDILDRSFKSYLALDNFRICAGIPGFGDLNQDCSVDFFDFEILAKSWLADCNDPNVISDPNIPCNLFVTDPNAPENIVDGEFLLKMSEVWLEGKDD